MTRQEFITEATNRLTAAGFHVSVGSWEDPAADRAMVFSAETLGSATFGHPKAEASWNEGRIHFSSEINSIQENAI